MYNANGVGIAAPQIGISKAIFVADFSFFKEEENFKEEELINMQQVFINPKIISETGDDFNYPEGCLSIPNISENVIRKEKLKISKVISRYVYSDCTLMASKEESSRRSITFPVNSLIICSVRSYWKDPKFI